MSSAPQRRVRSGTRTRRGATPADITSLPDLSGGEIGANASKTGRIPLQDLTLEILLYAFALIASLGLRLFDLAAIPLSPVEARIALSAMDVMPATVGSLQEFGIRLAVELGGRSDAVVRIIPAVLGALIPLAVLPMRPMIGRTAAMVAALGLAVAPLLVDQARQAGGVGIAALAGLLVAGLMARAREPRTSWTLLMLAIAVGLVSGFGVFHALAAVAIVWAISARSASAREKGRPAASPVPAPTLLLGLSALLGLATGGFTDISGLGRGVFEPLGHWATALTTAPAADAPRLGVLLLAGYALMSAMAALAFVAMMARGRAVPTASRADELTVMLLVWAGIAIVATLLRGTPDHAAMAVVPLTVLGARAAAALIAEAARHSRAMVLAGVAIVSWAYFLFTLAIGHVTSQDPVAIRYVGAAFRTVGFLGTTDEELRVSAERALIAFPIVLVLLAVLYFRQIATSAAWTSLLIGIAVVLIANEVHVTSNLTFRVVGNLAELPRAQQTSVDVRVLAADAHQVIQVLTINRKDRSFIVRPDVSDVVDWYLKPLNPSRIDVPTAMPAIRLLPATEQQPHQRYAGQQYQLSLTGNFRFENAKQVWRWLRYRETPVAPAMTDVKLWVRAQ